MSKPDAINNHHGCGTLQPGQIAKQPEWAMRRVFLPPPTPRAAETARCQRSATASTHCWY
ncbi:DUF4113 domain-containing protein [Pseudomonas psychrophila]|uniref:DUF4113 domain-containing protein n=1 Tax=Pseudomonas psychrophila TaxID=122355 RepID=UPI001F0A73DB|nr:DUF4113 domain-containing protein [Pseudomonas psychrophila]